MYTQSVSPYSRGYDPYFAQKVNQLVNAAKAGMTYNPTSAPQTTTTTQTSGIVVTPEMLEEYRQAIEETNKAYEMSKQGIIQDGNGQLIKNDGYVVKDGKDDGKISFGQKLKNLGKGVVKTFTGMFTDKNGKFSLKQTLKTALIGGACALATFLCPPVGSALIYAGLAIGTAGVVKNGIKAAKATTDQEAEQAWQGIGTSGTIVAMSLVGVKNKGAAANAKAGITKEAGVKGAIKGFFTDLKAGFKTNNQEIMSAVSDIKAGTFVEGVKNNVATKMFNVKDWQALKELDKTELRDQFCRNVKEQTLEKFGGKSEYVENAKKSIDSKIAKLEEEYANVNTKPERAYEIENEIAQLNKQRNIYNQSAANTEAQAKINENALAKHNSKLEQLESNLKTFKQELRNVTDENAKKALKSAIKGIKTEISNEKAMISQYQNYDAYLNNRILKMAHQNFEYKNPSKLAQYWTTTKPTIGLSSTPWVVQTEAISNATSKDPTLATVNPEEVSALIPQYQQELEAQKQQLEEEYQTLLTQAQSNPAPQTNPNVPTEMPPIIPPGTKVEQGAAQKLLNNWITQYGIM